MHLHQLEPGLFAANEPGLQDLPALVRRGIKALVDNRVDDDRYGAVPVSTLRKEADRVGLLYAHVPVPTGSGLDESLAALREVLISLPRPLVLFSHSGVRSATAFIQSQRAPG